MTLKHDSDSEDLATSSDLQEVIIDGAGGMENLLKCFKNSAVPQTAPWEWEGNHPS